MHRGNKRIGDSHQLFFDSRKAGQGGYPEPLLKKIDRRDYLRNLLQSTLYKDKIYRTDSGLAVSAGFRFSEDRGSLYENLVAVSLKKEEIVGRISLFYWKSPQNEEVDFIIKEELHCDDLLLLNDRVEQTETFRWQNAERPIRLMPLWKWLLSS